MPRKPYLILDQNVQSLYPFSDRRGVQFIPFRAALTYMAFPRKKTVLGARGCIFGFPNHRKIELRSCEKEAQPTKKKIKVSVWSLFKGLT